MEQSTNTRPSGRSISVTAYGDTADELELDALDKARAFFGGDIRLQVRRDYQAVSTEFGTDNGTGKSHRADIAVDVIE